MKKILAIVGPTASGKTRLSIELAKELDGEIISCDSMQIYKKMDIGTAKPTPEEQSQAIHHLIDIVEPTDDFSVVEYVDEAKKKIDEIMSRGKLPILCGGTGLYLENIINNTDFSDSGRDDRFRKMLEERAISEGVDGLYAELCLIDPESAEKVHKNNVKRVIRALEIYHATGKTKTEWDKESRKKESPYDVTIIFLDYKDRQKLYDRIDLRVDIMLEMGLLNEVKDLLQAGEERLSQTALQAIGYKEMIGFIRGESSLDESIELIKKNSRNYAKRQLTWFRRYSEAIKFYVDEYSNFDEIVNNAKKLLTN